MSSEKALEVLPQHLAGRQVLQVIQDRVNMKQQHIQYGDWANDPVLSRVKFVRFVVPPHALPDGTQVPAQNRLITPAEARDLLAQDLARNAINLRRAYDAYVARVTVAGPTRQVPIEGLPVPGVDGAEDSGVGGEVLVQPDAPPEG